MARRKRIPYDPPGERGKKRRQGVPLRPDQLFMTRRMFLARGGIVAAFSVLAGKLGHMQVMRRDNFRALAKDNYVRSEQLKSTRGLILDRNGKELAVNRRRWEVRVVPADLPDDDVQRARVLNHLIAELGLPDALVLNPNSVPTDHEEAIYARTHRLLNKPNLDVQVTNQGVRQSILSVPGRRFRVNDQWLDVFVYKTVAAREADSRRTDPDGALVDGKPVAWETPPEVKVAPTVIESGNVLALLMTDAPALTAYVTRGMAPLADAPLADDPAGLEKLAEVLRTSGLRAWRSYIKQTAAINNLVVLEDNLTVDQAALCRASLNELPGVSVMNVLEYRIENAIGSHQPVVVKSGVPRELALKLEANRLFLPGVSLDDSGLVRHYPAGEAMSHLLGYVGKISPEDLAADREASGEDKAFYAEDDTVGVAGLEWTMEKMLRGHKGKRWVEFDNTGVVQRVIPEEGSPAVPGKNLKLTIDAELQEAVSGILKWGIDFANEDRRQQGKLDEKYPADNGAIVVMNPRSGEILAMASFPHFDNQLFADGISQAKFEEYAEDKKKPLLNHAIMETYPPGSTLKPFHAASALNDGKITPETTFNCTGAIFVPLPGSRTEGNHYECWNKAGHQSLNVYDAIKESCDVFFYNVGVPGDGDLHYYDENGESRVIEFAVKHPFTGLGIKQIKKDLMEQFWFGQQTEVDLPGEQEGDVPDPDWLVEEYGPTYGWSAGDTVNVSIGQGYFKATPLQLAVNTAAIANGGTVHKPLLVREASDDSGQNTQTFAPKELRRIGIASHHLDVVREGMRRVVHERGGSAFRFDDERTRWPYTNPDGEDEILIAGKTGTAEIGVADEATGDYARQNAWFTGYAPFDNPEVVVTLVLHDGGGSSTYAVPVADRVMRAYFELVGKRKRGKMLRGEDGAPPDPSLDAPTPEAAPTDAGAPAQDQD